jgi:regulatory protein
MANLGYIDDAAYALSKSRALTGRGYGPSRVRQSLRAAGVGEEDARSADELAKAERVNAALQFARRRHLGPYCSQALDRGDQQRALASMIRAGHTFEVARAILALEPGSDFDVESLFESR